MIFEFKSNYLPNVRFIGDINYTKPWTHFSRTSDEFIIYIIKKGYLYIKEDNKNYVLKPGDFFLFQPHINHKGYRACSCNYYYIHFKYDSLKMIDSKDMSKLIKEYVIRRNITYTSNCLSYTSPTDYTSYIPKVYSLLNSQIYYNILEECIDIYDKRLENYKELISCKILELLIKISWEYVTSTIESCDKHLSKPYVKTQKILDYLNKEYYNKITSSTIEQVFESNYDYLNRCFHKITGYTISHYLNMIRINKAKELILTTPLKFSEIAYLVGINNPYYFSKLFKKYTGMTSSQYYKQYYKN